MSISASIKALLSLKGMRQYDLMEVLKVGSKQALSNKFSGGRWSASDLVVVAGACNARLCFVTDDGTILPITADDPVGAGAGVQASPAAGQGVPVGESEPAGVGRVTPISNRKSEKPLTD